jgi:predicted  nucleic acid-binding Zn-ribbon protein
VTDDIKTVDDLIKAKNLTPEELIQFKDMIDEFKERERKIEEHVTAAKSNLNQLSNTMRILGERASVIGKELRESLDEMERIQLQMMPNDKFYRE